MKVDFRKRLPHVVTKRGYNSACSLFELETTEIIRNKFKELNPRFSKIYQKYDEETQSEYLSMFWYVKVSDEKENNDKIIVVWIN